VDHLSRNELGDGEPHDVDGVVDVGDDASHLGAGQTARFGSEAEHNLVAVDGVDVEVDDDSGAAGAGQPVRPSAPTTCSPHSATWA
jgi:hypothetical protein